MAFHFRKLKNTLRLLPSTKTIGFSTRLNEGENHGTFPEGSPVTPSLGTCESFSGCAKHVKGPDSIPSMTSSLSELDLANQFLPALISRPGRDSSLPVLYDDLAQILRLPQTLPSTCSRDLPSIVTSVLRIVHPTSDDIFVGSQNVSHVSFSCCPNSAKGLFRSSSTNLEEGPTPIHKTLPLDSFDNDCVVRNTNLPPLPTLVASTPHTNSHNVCGHPPAQSFSTCDQLQNDLRASNSTLSYSSHSSAEPVTSLLSSNTGGPPGKNPSKDSPTPEQMQKIKEKLEKTVHKLFSGRQDYSVLHKNVVLENNLFGDNKTCVGLLAYGIEILKLRLRIHARFSNTSVELQSVTMLEQSNVIRIHWRLKGLSQIQTLKFWRVFQRGNPISKDDYEWLEAFSYFHIGKDGLVHKHRIDRMIPDDTSGTEKITNTLRELLTPAKPLVS